MQIELTGTRHLLSFTAISLVAVHSPLFAQDADVVFALDPISVEQRDQFVGAADRATTMYVADDELERARTGDLKDVFAGVASVSVGGALPLTQKIFLNGVDMLNLGVTIDEASQNNRAFHHVSANAIDPGLLKQVRADATVAPADAGPAALAGSVVFETVDPEDILQDGKSFGGNLRTSYSTNGETAQSALTLAGRQGNLSWLGYAKYADGQNYESGNGTEIEGTAADLKSFLGKVVYETAEGHRVEASAMRLSDSELRQFRANFGGLSGVTDNLRLYDTTRESYSFSYENVFATGYWDPKFSLGYSESDIVVPDPYDSNGNSGTLSATLENRFHLNDIDTITAGLDFQRRHGEYLSPTYSTDLEETSRNIGLFAQARIEPTDRWRLSAGARYDTQDFTGTDGTDVSSSGLSGNASAIYDVTDAFALRGGLSSVFGGIDIEDNYTYESRVPWVYSGLEASRANNATIGFDYAVGDLTLSGEVFRTRISNARSADANFDFESRGYNIGATYGWQSGFARFTLSRSNVKVDDVAAGGYEALDFGAPLGTVVAFELEQETKIEGLRVGGGIDAALKYSVPTGEGSEYANLPAYQVVNVFAEYTPPSMNNLVWRGEISNLFDKEYADRATYGGEYSSVTTLKEPGRTLTVTAVVNF
jgi:hemoglobin/transferrin/lactoferrin receptor protein